MRKETMLMKKKLHGTAEYLHKIYTLERGPQNHDDVQQTKGILKLATAILISFGIERLAEKIENTELKINKPRKGE